MQNIASCVERQHFTQDKFQSYVCRMLLFAAIAATFPPLIVMFQSAGGTDGGCIGEEFVVYAHYSMHGWLSAKFNRFKDQSYAGVDTDICYELMIEDSVLDVSDGTHPSVWIPETYHWIDVAEQSTPLIKDRSTDCALLTNVPFGIITWKKFADILSPDRSAIPLQRITDLAAAGWDNMYEDEINKVYPDVTELHFGHGHPNVTSGGLLGLLLSVLTTNDTSLSSNDACDTSWIDSDVDSSALEKQTIFTAPIDYNLPQVMMSRGPEFLHMAFGFENDVVSFNVRYKEELLYLWNDTLAMVYLEDTYWLTHPICVLTAASWYDSSVASKFMQWITTCDTCVSDLEQDGFRPYNMTLNQSTSVISADNGCNLDIENNDSDIEEPTVETALCIEDRFMSLKKHTRLTILLDVSEKMQTSVSHDETRWKIINDALPDLIDRLEDEAQIYLYCFHEYVLYDLGCSSTVSYPNGTLETARTELQEYFADVLAPRSGKSTVKVFDSLLETYIRVNQTRASEDPDDEYRYVILVITEDNSATDDNEDAFNILNQVSVLEDPLGIRIFPISYYGDEDSITYRTLEELATRTNGQFSTAISTELEDVLTEFAYYW